MISLIPTILSYVCYILAGLIIVLNVIRGIRDHRFGTHIPILTILDIFLPNPFKRTVDIQ